MKQKHNVLFTACNQKSIDIFKAAYIDDEERNQYRLVKTSLMLDSIKWKSNNAYSDKIHLRVKDLEDKLYDKQMPIVSKHIEIPIFSEYISNEFTITIELETDFEKSIININKISIVHSYYDKRGNEIIKEYTLPLNKVKLTFECSFVTNDELSNTENAEENE